MKWLSVRGGTTLISLTQIDIPEEVWGEAEKSTRKNNGYFKNFDENNKPKHVKKFNLFQAQEM